MKRRAAMTGKKFCNGILSDYKKHGELWDKVFINGNRVNTTGSGEYIEAVIRHWLVKYLKKLKRSNDISLISGHIYDKDDATNIIGGPQSDIIVCDANPREYRESDVEFDGKGFVHIGRVRCVIEVKTNEGQIQSAVNQLGGLTEKFSDLKGKIGILCLLSKTQKPNVAQELCETSGIKMAFIGVKSIQQQDEDIFEMALTAGDRWKMNYNNLAYNFLKWFEGCVKNKN
jgi:hypothetical protein